jgi:hypothetical protein
MRYAIDQLLRDGLYASAEAMAKATALEDLTNVLYFREARDVEESLRRRETAVALAWTDVHTVRLEKLKSTLQFKLHLQAAIEVCVYLSFQGINNSFTFFFPDF